MNTTSPPMPDLELWHATDIAHFLRVDLSELDDVVAAAGVPVLYLGGVGMRAVPSVVRAWAASRSQSVIVAPRSQRAPASKRTKLSAVAGGTATSGRLVQP